MIYSYLGIIPRTLKNRFLVEVPLGFKWRISECLLPKVPGRFLFSDKLEFGESKGDQMRQRLWITSFKCQLSGGHSNLDTRKLMLGQSSTQNLGRMSFLQDRLSHVQNLVLRGSTRNHMNNRQRWHRRPVVVGIIPELSFSPGFDIGSLS